MPATLLHAVPSAPAAPGVLQEFVSQQVLVGSQQPGSRAQHVVFGDVQPDEQTQAPVALHVFDWQPVSHEAPEVQVCSAKPNKRERE